MRGTFSRDAAAGDVGHALTTRDRPHGGEQRFHVDSGRLEDHIAQRATMEVRIEIGPGELDDLADQRIAIGVGATRRETQHHITRLDPRAIDELGLFDRADRNPARSYSPSGYMPGISAVSPPISAQPASSQPWAIPLTTSAAVSTWSLPQAK